MTPDELIVRGRVLYGENWKKPLAYNLGVTTVQVHNWVTGKTPIKEKHQTKIRELLTRRLGMLRVLLQEPKIEPEILPPRKVSTPFRLLQSTATGIQK